MNNIKILWVDDEIDMLRPHIIFLASKGYKVDTINNGNDALDLISVNNYDLIFLDENMPGLSGIEVLSLINKINPLLPVIMITKSEEESIMEDAIGSNIADYLIKPVNPNQILLAIKKNIDSRKIISNKNSSEYQQEFREIGIELSNDLDFEEWISIYKKIVTWELKLEKSTDEGILGILQIQKEEANKLFSNYVCENYETWVGGKIGKKPCQSHIVVKDKILPMVESGKTTFLFVIDNLRYDQWKTIYPILSEYFRIENEDIYYSILPTTTQYARNALFSGLMPSMISSLYPHYWTEESDEGTKNQFEEQLFAEQLKRLGSKIKFSYNKVLSFNSGKKLQENLHTLMHNDLNIIVYNFVDMLSHARTEMEVIRELASDEKAYRSLTLSWFNNSPLLAMMKYVAEKGGKMIITTDHGSIKVKKPIKVIGDKNTNTNLRYKFGKSLEYKEKEVFSVRKPENIFLPKPNLSTSYIFCKDTDFFVYPNNFNYFASFYKDSFQHGGISLEEMLIPLITLNAK
ncbi:MAG: two-component system response regulator [Bacteroidetes bacterium CG2_30_33_31]|nr:MAG: two-component system response regulator [Bacteroidetes bacterium CG2_30_33_31]